MRQARTTPNQPALMPRQVNCVVCGRLIPEGKRIDAIYDRPSCCNEAWRLRVGKRWGGREPPEAPAKPEDASLRTKTQRRTKGSHPELLAARRQIAELKGQREDERRQSQRLMATRDAELQRVQAEGQRDVERVSAELAAEKGRGATQNAELQRLKTEVAEKTAALDKATTQETELRQALVGLYQWRSEAEERLRAAAEETKEALLKAGNKRLFEEFFSETGAQIRAVRSELSEQTQELKTVRSELSERTQELKTNQNDLEFFRDQNKELFKQRDGLVQQLAEMQSAYRLLDAAKVETSAWEERCLDEPEDSAATCEELRERAEAAETKLTLFKQRAEAAETKLQQLRSTAATKDPELPAHNAQADSPRKPSKRWPPKRTESLETGNHSENPNRLASAAKTALGVGVVAGLGYGVAKAMASPPEKKFPADGSPSGARVSRGHLPGASRR